MHLCCSSREKMAMRSHVASLCAVILLCMMLTSPASGQELSPVSYDDNAHPAAAGSVVDGNPYTFWSLTDGQTTANFTFTDPFTVSDADCYLYIGWANKTAPLYKVYFALVLMMFYFFTLTPIVHYIVQSINQSINQSMVLMA